MHQTLRKGQFEAHPETKLLYLRLTAVPVGEIVTYAELSSEIGRDVRTVRSHLASARERAKRQDKIVFDVVTSVGLKRLPDGGIVNVVGAFGGRIRRAATRALRTAGCAQYDNLTPDEQRRLNVGRAQLGIVRAATAEPTARKLLAIEERGAKLSPSDMLAKLVASVSVKKA